MRPESKVRLFNLLMILLIIGAGIGLLVKAVPYLMKARFQPPSQELTGAYPPAPDFVLTSVEGSSVELSQYRGERPVLLYFWATWCPSCVKSLPLMGTLCQSQSKMDLKVLTINVGGGDSLDRIRKFQEGIGLPCPILYDQEGAVTRKYRVEGIPLYILVSKEGRIVYRGHEPPDDVKSLF